MSEVQTKQCEAPKAQLVTAQGAGVMLGISTRSVWRFSREGKIPKPVHVGCAARWRVAELLLYINSLDK